MPKYDKTCGDCPFYRSAAQAYCGRRGCYFLPVFTPRGESDAACIDFYINGFDESGEIDFHDQDDEPSPKGGSSNVEENAGG